MDEADPIPVANVDLAPPVRSVMAVRRLPEPVRAVLRVALSEYTVLLLAIAYFLIACLFVPDVLTSRNLSNLFMNMLPLLAVAIGQTIVLITGGIDLSVTSIIAATSVIAAWIMTASPGAGGAGSAGGAMIVAAIAVAILIGLALGAMNGAAVAMLDMPPFIVTLSTMMTLSGATLWATKSKNIGNLPDAFTDIGFGSVLGVPHALLIVGALAIAMHLLLTSTLLGRWLYATGHNARAALISGVPVRRVTLCAYAISGFCAAVASVLYTARLETGSPTLGREILLDVVGAAVIGGTSLFGGRGKVLWTIFGVLLFALISNTLNLLGLQHYTIMMVKGAVILVAAGLDLLRNRVLASI